MISVEYRKFKEVCDWCGENVAPYSIKSQGFSMGPPNTWKAVAIGAHPIEFYLFISDSKKELMALIKFGRKYK